MGNREHLLGCCSTLATNKRNPGSLSQADERGFFEQESTPGLHRDGTDLRFARDAQGFGADDGNIETHVLIRFG